MNFKYQSQKMKSVRHIFKPLLRFELRQGQVDIAVDVADQVKVVNPDNLYLRRYSRVPLSRRVIHSSNDRHNRLK